MAWRPSRDEDRRADVLGATVLLALLCLALLFLA